MKENPDIERELKSLKALGAISIVGNGGRILVSSMDTSLFSITIWCSDASILNKIEMFFRGRKINLFGGGKEKTMGLFSIAAIVKEVGITANLVREIADLMDIDVIIKRMKTASYNVDFKNADPSETGL